MKNTIYALKGLGAFLWCVLVRMCREPMFSTVVFVAVQTNVARKAFCAPHNILQYDFICLDQLFMTNLGFMFQ